MLFTMVVQAENVASFYVKIMERNRKKSKSFEFKIKLLNISPFSWGRILHVLVEEPVVKKTKKIR
jgi:hypothetical protein